MMKINEIKLRILGGILMIFIIWFIPKISSPPKPEDTVKSKTITKNVHTRNDVIILRKSLDDIGEVSLDCSLSVTDKIIREAEDLCVDPEFILAVADTRGDINNFKVRDFVLKGGLHNETDIIIMKNSNRIPIENSKIKTTYLEAYMKVYKDKGLKLNTLYNKYKIISGKDLKDL